MRARAGLRRVAVVAAWVVAAWLVPMLPARAADAGQADVGAASAAASMASPPKVLRYAFRVAETSFDPAALSDIYSRIVTGHIFEGLYGYDPLARPALIRPVTAVALPEVDNDWRRFTIHVKPGTYFADDPAFGGKRRELVAADYVYALKRIADPAVRSPTWSSIEQLGILGLGGAAPARDRRPRAVRLRRADRRPAGHRSLHAVHRARRAAPAIRRAAGPGRPVRRRGARGRGRVRATGWRASRSAPGRSGSCSGGARR